jgi:hypothetical protein
MCYILWQIGIDPESVEIDEAYYYIKRWEKDHKK